MDQTRNQVSIVQQMLCSFFGALILALMAEAASAGQVVPGLSGKHPLTQAQVGELLIAELRCAACHGGIEPKSLVAKSAPDLSEAGARISPDYLKRFLAPASDKSGADFATRDFGSIPP